MRTKLVVLVGVSAVALAVLTVLQARSQLQGHTQLVTARHDLAISTGAVGVADALQRERDAVISVIGQDRQDFRPLMESAGHTDAAISLLRAAATDRDTLTPAVRTALARALVELDGLATLRQTTRQTRYPDGAALARYSQILGRLTHVGQAVVENTSTLPIAATAATMQSLALATDQLTLQNSIVLASAYHRDLLPAQANDLRAAQARFDAAVATAIGQANPRARQLYLDTVNGAEVDERSRMVQRVLIESSNAERITVAPQDINRSGDATAERIRTVRRTLSAQASSDVDAAIAQAWQRAMVGIVVAVALLALTFGAALLMSLSLSRPLRELRRAALRVADHGLPEAVERILADPNPQLAAQNAIAPVPITTREEVGQVARAFDAVHGEAVRLAVQQALLRDNVNAMFVNLSRRSQALVERQLILIDQLEQDEQDPDQLASLFDLDHLATRMRRNSENLLVLAGTDLAGRSAQLVPVSEVLGAAVSEVENYTRIQIGPTPEAMVHGRAVKDLLHLIAELLDNATAFSSPETKVLVSTAITRRGELAIEIQDRGVGIAEQELRDANTRLADPPEIDVAISRRMGLYVVGRLGKRHGISVRLRANEDVMGGTTALVHVPAALIQRPHPPTPVAVPIAGAATGTISDPPPPVGLFQAQTPVDLQPLVSDATRRAYRRRARTAASLVPPPLARLLRDEAAWESPGPSSTTDVDSPTLRMPAVEQLPAWFRRHHPVGEQLPGALTQDSAATLALDHATSLHDTAGTVLVHPAEAGPVRPARPHSRQRTAQTAPEPSDIWSSASDGGQARADSVLGTTGEALTATGLPRRVPQARLIPGAATPPETKPVTPHDPNATRARLASLQQGVRRGRHERFESLHTHQTKPDASDQETECSPPCPPTT